MKIELESKTNELLEGLDDCMVASLLHLYKSCAHAVIECIENKELREELTGIQYDIENLLVAIGLAEF
jgi:hypothetical protein